MSSNIEPAESRAEPVAEPPPPAVSVCIEAGAKADDVTWVNQRLSDHAVATIGPLDYVPVTIFLRDDSGKLWGGLIGYSIWSMMQIDTLWVDETLRCRGHGRALLDAAEKAARIRGCKIIHAETFCPNALRFYQKAGYDVFGQLSPSPDAPTRFYLSKTLQPPKK